MSNFYVMKYNIKRALEDTDSLSSQDRKTLL